MQALTCCRCCLPQARGPDAAGPQRAQQETELVVRGVCTTKLPTLTFEDNTRFRALLGDTFPGVQVSDASNPELEAAVAAAASDMGLELLPQQVLPWVIALSSGKAGAWPPAGLLCCWRHRGHGAEGVRHVSTC